MRQEKRQKTTERTGQQAEARKEHGRTTGDRATGRRHRASAGKNEQPKDNESRKRVSRAKGSERWGGTHGERRSVEATKGSPRR